MKINEFSNVVLNSSTDPPDFLDFSDVEGNVLIEVDSRDSLMIGYRFLKS